MSPNQKIVKMRVSQLATQLNDSEIQRVSIPERIEQIYQSFLKTCKQDKEIVSSGVLTVGDFKDTFYLLDGQHRFKAFLRLYQETKHDQILAINIITICSAEEMLLLFNTINNSVPVAEIPAGICLKDKHTVVKHFTDKYPLIFSATRTGKVQRPHIHPTAFEEQIHKLLDYYNGDELIAKLEKINEELKTAALRVFKDKGDTEQKLEVIRNKATQKGKLYFGMYKNFECFERLLPVKFIRHRQTIPPVLRDRIWRMYYGQIKKEGVCPFCECQISKISCHMAHDIAHANGGEATIDNLYPCCSSCNLSMGTKSYEEMRIYLNSLIC